MMSQSLRTLTSTNDDASAWNALFHSYNKTHSPRFVGPPARIVHPRLPEHAQRPLAECVTQHQIAYGNRAVILSRAPATR